ncbi:MAG: hypothetical protein AAF913_15000 [Pseudomonadota bacterium]
MARQRPAEYGSHGACRPGLGTPAGADHRPSDSRISSLTESLLTALTLFDLAILLPFR